MEKKKLIIIGGGFGGLTLARDIDKDMWDVTIIDANNFHSFPPLFYQVASSGLEPASISFPFRRELRSRKLRGVRFYMGHVETIDVENRQVHTSDASFQYDSLVMAAGTTNNFFGNPSLEKHVLTLKSTTQAIRCRNEILTHLEEASLCHDAGRRQALLTFVVIGGGPAGVEIAGALGELKRFIIRREYPEINPDELRVIIIEGSEALLRTMGKRSSDDAAEGLRQLMVEIWLGKTMKDYDGETITFADGSSLKAYTVIWSAGVEGSPIKLTGTHIAPSYGARWEVDQYNRVRGLDNIFAIGDIALMAGKDYPKGHPQVAQAAIQMARNLARNLSGRIPRVFVYRDKGSMATIGRNRAVVDIGKAHLSGRMAWIAWLIVHLMSLLGMRNRAVVLIDWIWNYCTFSSGLRLIMRPDRYPFRSHWNEK
ncbi:MAG: NAD(P)/FAD-dependent oxidoreductase [Muribaculaceae bacterium]|nr:NAD(P)/FAD-dependent oxidoreductase [Muribaculaceae bacterium]